MVKKLTGVDKKKIDNGVTFPEAAEGFREWCGDDFAFVTWGYDDIPIFKQNLAAYGLDGDWCDRWYNLQIIFNMQTDGEKNQRSLEYAMAHFGIEEDDDLHDALNDAWFTTCVARCLDLEEGFADYERLYWKMRPQKIAKAKKIGTFRSKRDVFSIATVNQFLCPVCGEVIKEKIRWKLSGDGSYWAEAACGTHGDFTVRMRFKRSPEGWQATRIVKNTKPRVRKRKKKKKETATEES